ncbi:hypothetical protein GP486_005440 [Trichoglossum hirsutum]|uniref:DUF7099 domain-containing protein n=1 Tax=Trichoglossum hirsutum TaxID=265104 RepID=A0A9P8L992_9PEZI|nr:hypothetical protein GP486_005440 [Trichoglossum hirsutum]
MEMIFGLQRMHLQSRPPHGMRDQPSDLPLRNIVERLPYILTLKTAKDAFACLTKQTMDYLEMCSGKQDDRTSLRRTVVIRALVSGTRMLCLHPDIISRHASLSSLSLRIGPYFGLWERILCQACNFALRQEPRRQQTLKMQRMGLNGNMLPPDDPRLLNMANEYINNFFSDPHSKYWALYDISWSIVAAFIKSRAVKADANVQEYFSLATEIADGIMAEACKGPEDAETCALLLDIVESLHPILVAGTGQREGTWQASYEKILSGIFPGRASLFKVFHACVSEEVITLRGFEYDLKQRQLAVRSGNRELSHLLSRLEDACLAGIDTYNECPSSSTHDPRTNQSKAPLKLYLLNCGVGHIIAENHEYVTRLLSDGGRRLSWENGSLVVPGGDRCPFCVTNADPHPTFTRLKEVLPLNNMLEAISQKRQELDASGNQGPKVYTLTEESTHANTTEEHKDTRCGELLYPSPHCTPPLESGLIPVNPPSLIPVNLDDSSSSIGSSVGYGQVSQPVQGVASQLSRINRTSPWSPTSQANGSRIFSVVKKFGFPKKVSITESYAELPAGESSALGVINLEQLGQGKKNVAVSPDFKRIIIWTKKYMAVLRQPDMEMNPFLMEGSDLIITSNSYCAIVKRYIDHDEVRWYSFNQGFDCPVHEVLFRQNGSPDVVQCLAIMPDDTYLAVGLKGGSIKLFDLRQPTKSRILNFGARGGNGPTVASLSFTADAGELVASIRTGSIVNVYHCSEPFNNPIYSFTHDIGNHERDNQGVSSVIRSSDRDLFCFTSWTLHGIPILRDGLTCKTKTLEKAELIGPVDINNRIQQAVFSRSGRMLVLVDATGSIFKIFPDNIEKVRAERIASSLRLRWKAQSIKNQQLLDVKIADDEKFLYVVWIDEKKNQAQIAIVPTGVGD